MGKITEQQKQQILNAWEKPLALPKPVPKSAPKKKGRKSKESEAE